MRPIDADPLLNKYTSNRYKRNILTAQTDYAQGARDIIEDIVDAPTIEPERKKGKWIITDTYNNQIWHCNCSACGKDPQYFISGTEDWWINKLPNYCPNCGAKMGEEENE